MASARDGVRASTYRGNAGAGIVQPRAKVNLSDFLTTATNAHVARGPFEYSVMRIGKQRNGKKVGVFLYCQQHAREWATPLTCLETAEQLLRNYAIDPRTRKLVDGLDIFILPSSNPDGAHYSMHNFASAAEEHDERLRRRRQGDATIRRGELLDAPDQPGNRPPVHQHRPRARGTGGAST